jgi:N-acetyl-alpha-D-muramate 1-phosphate uridylyltransferase
MTNKLDPQQQHLFPAVILAGGLATRLHPVTQTIPKSLIDINGKAFIYHQLKLLKSKGITQVVICLGYLGEQVIDYLHNIDLEIDISYSLDGDKLLGTAGAIKKALPHTLQAESFFVIYGDSYLRCEYIDIQKYFQSQHQPALMTVYKNEGQWDSSNVEFVAGKINKYDKVNKTAQMQYIDYGLGIFNKSAFDLIPANESFDLAKLYQMLLAKQQLCAYEVKERFYEIGSFAGIEELSRVISE